MTLFVLFGERKSPAPGESKVAALDCMDEAAHTESPGHLAGMLAKYQRYEDFERVGIVQVTVNDAEVLTALQANVAQVSGSVQPIA